MIVPLTREIMDSYDDPFEITVRGYASVKDDRILGVMGLYYSNGHQFAFARISDELKEDKRELLKLTRKVISVCARTVFAVCDNEIPKADNFLRHWGFSQLDGDLWLGHPTL